MNIGPTHIIACNMMLRVSSNSHCDALEKSYVPRRPLRRDRVAGSVFHSLPAVSAFTLCAVLAALYISRVLTADLVPLQGLRGNGPMCRVDRSRRERLLAMCCTNLSEILGTAG
jgi:hypothetical protein